jgi:hypothetical protein
MLAPPDPEMRRAAPLAESSPKSQNSSHTENTSLAARDFQARKLSRFSSFCRAADCTIATLAYSYCVINSLRLTGLVQQGHLCSRLMIATIKRRRIVVIEFGICRSVRIGGASGSVIFGNGRFFERCGGTRS